MREREKGGMKDPYSSTNVIKIIAKPSKCRPHSRHSHPRIDFLPLEACERHEHQSKDPPPQTHTNTHHTCRLALPKEKSPCTAHRIVYPPLPRAIEPPTLRAADRLPLEALHLGERILELYEYCWATSGGRKGSWKRCICQKESFSSYFVCRREWEIITIRQFRFLEFRVFPTRWGERRG